MNLKIAILIPVYNTEKYLHQCLTSAIEQTLEEIEIIVVNDASTDGSLAIIQEFQKKDSRIHLINFTENQGNGVGRNTAIQNATAEYILFLDSDDWLEHNAAELTYNKAKSENYQVLIFGFTQHIDFNKRKNTKKEKLPFYLEEDKEFYKYFLMHRNGVYPMPWIYLISRKLLNENKITFSEDIYFEDLIFVTKVLYYIDKIGVINHLPLYNYRIRQHSIMQSTSKKKIDDLYSAHNYLKEFLKEKEIFKQYQEAYLVRFLVDCVAFSFMDYFKMSQNQKDKELNDFMKSIRKSTILSKDNLLLIKEVSKELPPKEKERKRHYKIAFRFLIGIRYYYYYSKFMNKLGIQLHRLLYYIK